MKAKTGRGLNNVYKTVFFFEEEIIEFQLHI